MSYFPLPVFQNSGMLTVGLPPILVDKSKHCDDCGQEHSLEKCPLCGSWIMHGFGLMLGGYGFYKHCNNEECDWYWKQVDSGE